MESTAMFTPSIVKVLVAAVSSFVLGGLWYGPLLGKAWLAATGLTEAQAKAGSSGRIFGLSFLLAFVQAWVFAMFLGPEPALPFALGAGASAGLCWVAAAFGINDLFERRSVRLWAINGAFHTLAFTLYGLVFGLWH